MLQEIVDNVVSGLGCVGAILATLEADNSLPVRAYSIGFSKELFRQLEEQLGISLIGPKAVAHINDPRYKDNLSVRAVKGLEGQTQKYILTDKLHDLFRPIVNKPLSDLAQRVTGIRQVLAVPFFIEDEIAGNIFAATNQEFSERDINVLTAFANQAATIIQRQRHIAEAQALEQVLLALQRDITDETQVLQTIANAVVQTLGYVGALMTTLEAGNALPVRTYCVGFGQKLLAQLENTLGLKLDGPKSVVYLDDPQSKENLSVRAVKGASGRPEKFIVSDQLYDLFRPVVKKPLADLAQRLTGIKQVIALPFFLEDEVVGNLFVATRKSKFSKREIDVLTTFSQQAAVGVRNARLYRKAEERRQIAEMFGRMAFSAATNVHALRNQIGAVRAYLDLLGMSEDMSDEERLDILATSSEVTVYLDQAADTLDNLHEPWRQTMDVFTDINESLVWAIRKTLPGWNLEADQASTIQKDNLTLHYTPGSNLPPLKTSPDMLTETFRILIRNALEAMQDKRFDRTLWLETKRGDHETLEIHIRDKGMGIKPENLSKIFEMGWSTKSGKGMGFGLFWTKDYIEGLGGNISVESTWRKGSKFFLQIPSRPTN